MGFGQGEEEEDEEEVETEEFGREVETGKKRDSIGMKWAIVVIVGSGVAIFCGEKFWGSCHIGGDEKGMLVELGDSIGSEEFGMGGLSADRRRVLGSREIVTTNEGLESSIDGRRETLEQ